MKHKKKLLTPYSVVTVAWLALQVTVAWFALQQMNIKAN